ncbi:MAG: toxin-antitoxin system HicB family antitoxin [Acidobacteria bacterium]|nr:toxin-antitoxin system HicB family antitoxin [Acidobacteriota bacterium]MBI3427231.1 toxin-antitoxin system HicB family antitoxin [Acidobacteriota bacterium]
MTNLTVSVPDSIYRQVATLAHKDQVTLDQFVSTALAEKVSALLTEDYLAQRAARADRQKFLAVMAKVPDVEPEEFDRLD